MHKMLHVVTVVVEHANGTIEQQSRELGGFKRDCRALSAWLAELGGELVVMVSTGIYWKGPASMPGSSTRISSNMSLAEKRT